MASFCIAIPADRNFAEMNIDVTPFNVRVKLLQEIHHIQSANIKSDSIDVIYKFLEFEIRRQLSSNNQLWKLNTSQFFFKSLSSPAKNQL